jgi:hypothetical protein
MPERKADMIRKLDAYLLKVGAWTMEEVYETRLDELRNWIERDHKDVAELKGQLASNPGDKKLQAALKEAQDKLERRQRTIDMVTANQTSDRWF